MPLVPMPVVLARFAGGRLSGRVIVPVAVLVVAVLVGGGILSACSGGGDAGWVERARAAPVDLAAPELEGEDVDEDLLRVGSGCSLGVEDARPGSIGGPSAVPGAVDLDADRGADNDPFAATGARPLPGPQMAGVPRPAAPVAAVVARPNDPDEHVAARNPDGVVTGPVPPPKSIGHGSASAAAVDGEDQPSQASPCRGDGL